MTLPVSTSSSHSQFDEHQVPGRGGGGVEVQPVMIGQSSPMEVERRLEDMTRLEAMFFFVCLFLVMFIDFFL